MVTNRPIAIVGGSAAGLYTASLLARAGRAVQVFERAERLDPTRSHADCHQPDARYARPVPSIAAVVNEINRFELFTDGRSATIPLDSPDLIIERSQLIRGLAEEAQANGASVELGRRFLVAWNPNAQGH